MRKPFCWFLSFLAILLFALPMVATTTSLSIGTQHFSNNSFQLDNVYAAAGGTGPFDNSQCGADDNSTGNCSASWSFTYSALKTVTGASFTIGLSSLDSIISANPLQSFTINGVDETSALNTAFESNLSILRPQTDATHTGMYAGKFFGGGPTAACWDSAATQNDFCSEYNVYTVKLSDPALLAALSGNGTVNLSLALQGPGAGAFGFDNTDSLNCVFDPFNQIGVGAPLQSNTPCPTTYNGARLDFSTLTVTGSNGGTAVPEPSTVTLLVAGLAGMVARRVRSKSV